MGWPSFADNKLGATMGYSNTLLATFGICKRQHTNAFSRQTFWNFWLATFRFMFCILFVSNAVKRLALWTGHIIDTGVRARLLHAGRLPPHRATSVTPRALLANQP